MKGLLEVLTNVRIAVTEIGGTVTLILLIAFGIYEAWRTFIMPAVKRHGRGSDTLSARVRPCTFKSLRSSPKRRAKRPLRTEHPTTPGDAQEPPTLF
jgi:hypothetical protein